MLRLSSAGVFDCLLFVTVIEPLSLEKKEKVFMQKHYQQEANRKTLTRSRHSLLSLMGHHYGLTMKNHYCQV